MIEETISSLIEKTKKGCGKRIRFEDINTKCGGEVGDIGIIKKVYCPTCQSRLQALNECAEMIENMGWYRSPLCPEKQLIDKREILGGQGK